MDRCIIGRTPGSRDARASLLQVAGVARAGPADHRGVVDHVHGTGLSRDARAPLVRIADIARAGPTHGAGGLHRARRARDSRLAVARVARIADIPGPDATRHAGVPGRIVRRTGAARPRAALGQVARRSATGAAGGSAGAKLTRGGAAAGRAAVAPTLVALLSRLDDPVTADGERGDRRHDENGRESEACQPEDHGFSTTGTQSSRSEIVTIAPGPNWLFVNTLRRTCRGCPGAPFT